MCSLRTVGVGCPEHAQVGPLPQLSKSRPRGPREIEDFVGSLSGRLVDLADSGVPIDELLGNAHMPAARWEPPNTTSPVSAEAALGCAALPTAPDPPRTALRA